MNLLLDIGNSSIAWVTQQGNQFIQSGSIYHDMSVSIEKQMSNQFSSHNEIETVLISSVLSKEQTSNVSDWFKTEWHCSVWQAETGSEFNGLKNSYTNTTKMGVDRWLNMIAAREEFKNRLCIIDCGTAMTIDIVGADGQHEGGVIVPGLMRLQEALISGTNRIQGKSNTIGNIDLANNTQAAISNGAMINLVATIEYTMSKFEKNGEKMSCVVTGGDASQVIENLSIVYEYRPMLIFNGMNRLYETSV